MLRKTVEYKRKFGSIENYLEYCQFVKDCYNVCPEAADILAEQKSPDFGYSSYPSGSFIFCLTEEGNTYWWNVEDSVKNWRRQNVNS